MIKRLLFYVKRYSKYIYYPFWIIYKIKNIQLLQKEVKRSDSGKKSDLIQSLPSNDCRYISYLLKSNDVTKIIFINWFVTFFF